MPSVQSNVELQYENRVDYEDALSSGNNNFISLPSILEFEGFIETGTVMLQYCRLLSDLW